MTFAYMPDGTGMFFYREDHVPENCPRFTETSGLANELSVAQIDRLASRELGVDVVASADAEEAASRLWSIWQTKYPTKDISYPIGTPEVGRITALGHHDVVDQRAVYKIYAIYDPVRDRGKFPVRDRKFWRMGRQVLMFYWKIAEYGDMGIERSALKAWTLDNWAKFHSRQDAEKLLRWSIRRMSVYGFLHVQRYPSVQDARDLGVGNSAEWKYKRALSCNGRYGIKNFYSNFEDFVSARADEYEGPLDYDE